jgi:chorismate mutase/prephenate dehydratase
MMKMRMKKTKTTRAEKESLENLRRRIDDIDIRIIRLLNRRAEMALEVGRIKLCCDVPVRDPARETEVLAHVQKASTGPLSRELIVSLYRKVIAECSRLQLRRWKKGGKGPGRKGRI